MNNAVHRRKGGVAAIALAAICAGTFPAVGQDLVAVSDITGGSSVFVFRGGAKASAKRYTPNTRSRRTKANRSVTVKKINRQYSDLARVAPRRQRTQAVDPKNLPPQVRTMPKDQAARLFAGVGEYYIDKSDPDNAIEFFRESNILDPEYKIAQTGLSEALALKGNKLLEQDAAKTAKPFFDEALKFNPANAVAYYGLAEVYSDSEADRDALSNYEKALEFDKALTEIYVPLGILYYQAGEIAKADDLLTKALTSSADSAELQYFVGLIRYSQNRNQDALNAFQKAIAADPNYAEAHYYLAETLNRMGRTDETVVNYQKAITLKNNYFDAWNGLGSAYFALGKYSDAIAAFKQAVRLRNDNIEAYINLADAYRLSGLPNSFNDAEASYNLASTFIDRKPDFSRTEAADVYNKAGFVIAKQCEINMARAVPCRWDVAVKYLEKAVALSESPVDYANLGWAYWNAGRSDMFDKREVESKAKLIKARDSLQRAVDSNPQYLEGPLLNLGMTYSDLGDYKGAIEALKKVVKKEPTWVFAINELGIAYRRNNQLKEASEQFRRAIDQNNSYAVAWYNLGETEFKAGKMGEVKKAHSELKRLGRKDLVSRLEFITGGAALK